MYAIVKTQAETLTKLAILFAALSKETLQISSAELNVYNK